MKKQMNINSKAENIILNQKKLSPKNYVKIIIFNEINIRKKNLIYFFCINYLDFKHSFISIKFCFYKHKIYFLEKVEKSEEKSFAFFSNT